MQPELPFVIALTGAGFVPIGKEVGSTIILDIEFGDTPGPTSLRQGLCRGRLDGLKSGAGSDEDAIPGSHRCPFLCVGRVRAAELQGIQPGRPRWSMPTISRSGKASPLKSMTA